MNVLIVGGGGREHAIAHTLQQSALVSKLYCAPGNGGTSDICENVDIKATDIYKLKEFVMNNNIDFTVVGMEDPLALGIVDIFESAGLKIFGPRKNAAEIEWSKNFAKDFMIRRSIPTAQFKSFSVLNEAISYLEKQKFPLVIKADGLAAGKGVIICEDILIAKQAAADMLKGNKFGEAGSTIIIEGFLTGAEVSVLCFADGKTIVPMVSSQDHKKIFDNDMGPNTGGMGAFAPSPIYTEEIAEYCMNNIFKPTMQGMLAEGREYKGILYFGLILTGDGPKVIEYNARFGDPETQAVLPLLESDLMEIFIACCDGKLSQLQIKWKNAGSACVILASGGYPGKYEINFEITGLDMPKMNNDIIIFHSGTKKTFDNFYTNGGRVLGVTSVAENVKIAVNNAYNAIKCIDFKQLHYRTDIGKNA